jgi:dipeptidyl aminopeptidase/acylaminoacyl peptidase
MRVEWYFYPNEPHGFRTPEGREDYFRKIAEFLDRHLGPTAGPPSGM